mmetsp:Transcript_40680/g.105601  ORF Transcript_40680/g.105601 Transcript_40680/m.105601 type:complete len:130 (-) Transcript_40680:601-990(-)
MSGIITPLNLLRACVVGGIGLATLRFVPLMQQTSFENGVKLLFANDDFLQEAGLTRIRATSERKSSCVFLEKPESQERVAQLMNSGIRAIRRESSTLVDQQATLGPACAEAAENVRQMGIAMANKGSEQ